MNEPDERTPQEELVADIHDGTARLLLWGKITDTVRYIHARAVRAQSLLSVDSEPKVHLPDLSCVWRERN